MPKPKEGENEKDFVARCIPMVMEDGSAQDDDQAVAMCHTIFKDHMEGKDKRAKAVMKKETDGEHPAGHYLVVEDPEKVDTWHLRVRDMDGNLDHRLMGAAWAALHEGYRGNQYEGPNKDEAISKLMKHYEKEGMETPAGKSRKAESLSERVNDVESAWYHQFGNLPTAMPMYKEAWVVDVGEDHVIACMDGKYYKVPYSMADSEVTFAAASDWAEVEEKKEWIEKSKRAKTLRVKVKAAQAVISRQEHPTEASKRAKAFDEYEGDELSVLGVPFGGSNNGRDAEGEAFHVKTDLWIEFEDTVPVTYYHGFGPDDPNAFQDPPVVIGRAKYVSMDKRGHWFNARLDVDEPLAKRILENPENVRASSGALSHLVRVKAGGLIDVWPVGELALFDLNEWRQPANDFAVIEKKIPQAQAKAAGKNAAPGVADHKNIQRQAVQFLAKLSLGEFQ